jgi:hypothetical protein
MLRSPRLTVLLLALAGSPALVACGGGGGDDSTKKLLKDTFANSDKVRSGRLDVTLSVKTDGLRGLKQPIRATFGGPFQKPAPKSVPRFRFELGVSAGGRPFTAGTTSTGDRVFVSLQGSDYELPAAQAKTFRDSFSQVQGLAQLPSGNAPWLVDAKDEGDADVAGTATTHVSAGVDVRGLLDRLARNAKNRTARLTDAQKQSVVDAIKHPRFDVYTGKADKILRRLRIAFRIEVPADTRAQAGGLKAADVVLDYAIADLNRPQRIVAPTRLRPVSELTTRIQALSAVLQQALGGLGGGGASPGGGASAGQAQRYNECVQAAGTDQTKAQQCAKLLK